MASVLTQYFVEAPVAAVTASSLLKALNLRICGYSLNLLCGLFQGLSGGMEAIGGLF